MRVLLINNFFYMRGGDCKYMFDLAELLQQKGHEVAYFSMQHPQNFSNPYSPYFISNIDYDSLNKNRNLNSIKKVFSASFWNYESQINLGKLLKSFKPDIAHIQNILHHITPSIFPVLSKNGIPVVAHLHDYNLICPDIYLFRQGKICEKCFNGKYFYCALHKCKKGSLPASLLAASQRYVHNLLNVYDAVHRFICPTEFTKKIYQRANFKYVDRLTYLPNLVPAGNIQVSNARPKKNTIVYAGRLIEQKGIWTLLKSAQLLPEVPFEIYGDGEILQDLEKFCEENKIQNVKFMGWVTSDEIQNALQNAVAVVYPSEWYEITGLSIIEAAMLGKPAIVSGDTPMAEVVLNGETGITFKMGDVTGLAEAIRAIISGSLAAQMGGKAKTRAFAIHSPDVHYPRLMNIYDDALLSVR